MNWRKVLQLALIHVGVSITVVPVTSTLNRIMIADMGLSATLVAALIALPYVLSPVQVAMGDWTDRRLVWGRHRTPWIVIGGLMASFGSYLTAHAAYLMNAHFALGLLAAIGAFAIWGVGVNVASVSYLSLVSDLTQGLDRWRNRAISVMWTLMILSTIAISILLSVILAPFPDILAPAGEAAIYNAFGAVWLMASALVLFGAARLEAPADPDRKVHNKANDPLVAYRLLANNPSARRFFLYLLLILVSIHAQDVLLEPFGAEALGMTASVTSRLTAIWGAGVFITLTGGLPLMRRMGKKRSANLGALVAAAAFAFIIITGLINAPSLFMGAVFLLGLGGGLMTVSNLSFMLDMTVPEAAGLYIGAWGVANFSGQAIGAIASGLVRDVAFQFTGNALIGYATVFGLEIVGLLAAVWLFRHISVEEFRRDAEVRIQDVLALAVE